MKSHNIRLLALFLLLVPPGISGAADVVPPEVQLPGTQPLEVANLESPGRCDNCHAGYNDATTTAAGEGEPQDEPATGWLGATLAMREIGNETRQVMVVGSIIELKIPT